jgi:hypothetical protein
VVEILVIALVVATAIIVFNKFVRRRLFGREVVQSAPPPVPLGGSQTQAQQDTARRLMESELEQARERRGAADTRH